MMDRSLRSTVRKAAEHNAAKHKAAFEALLRPHWKPLFRKIKAKATFEDTYNGTSDAEVIRVFDTIYSQYFNSFYATKDEPQKFLLSDNIHSVSELLGLKSPEVGIKYKSTPATENPNFVQISPNNIGRLKGFTNENLGQMYEDLLEQKLYLLPDEKSDLLTAQRRKGRLHDEGAFENALQQWVEHNAIYCINKTIDELQVRLDTDEKVYEVANQLSLSDKATNVYFYADWAVISTDESGTEGIDFTGETKRPEHMIPENIQKIKDMVLEQESKVPKRKSKVPKRVSGESGVSKANWCLRQCGSYALISKCRYSFLITPKLVFVFRYHLIKDAKEFNKKVLGVEYDYFPYEKEDLEDGQLTLCKTIWALMMMAQNTQHCGIVPLDEMISLDKWYKYTESDHTYYIHHISEIIRETPPEGTSSSDWIDLNEAPKEAYQRIISRIHDLLKSTRRHEVLSCRVVKTMGETQTPGGGVKKRSRVDTKTPTGFTKKERHKLNLYGGASR